jgi:hypothetical protein
MERTALAAATLLFVWTSLALAEEPCAGAVRPGRSIGKVQLGAKVTELRDTGFDVRPLKGTTFLVLDSGQELRVEVDDRKRIKRIRLEASRVCIREQSTFELDLGTAGAEAQAPLAGCGQQAAQHRSSWQCPEQGMELFWEGKKSGASVFAPTLMKPFQVAPPPFPEAPKAVRKCETSQPVDGAVAEERCWDEPPPDPCAGNTAPMPELACGFFGRDERLALECYPIGLCMGRFTRGSGGRIQVYSEAEGWLGSMAASREHRGMRFQFASPPPVGSKLRIIVGGEVATELPPTALVSKAVSPSEFERFESTGVVAVRVRHLVGGRNVGDAFVLDLSVPRSAYSKREGPGPAK